MTLALLLTSLASADSLVLEDFEGRGPAWSRTEVVSEPVHSGEAALAWRVDEHPTIDAPRIITDWSSFDEFRFWAYLEKPVDFKIPLVFPAEGGYYITEWKLDWQGWKEHVFRLEDCRKAYEPVGWDRLSHFGFRAQGYGQEAVPEGLTLVFDDFSLHSPQDLQETSLDAWLARERRERMQTLKARGDPYTLSVLDSIVSWKAEPSLPEELTSAWQFGGFASRALMAAWAAASDDSPRKGDEVLTAHACALVDFCLSHQVDGSWFYSRKWDSGDPNSDRFALGPLMDAVQYLRTLPAGEARWSEWEAPLRALVDFQYEHWGLKSGHAWSTGAMQYPNQDVFHLYEMALAHRFWGEDRYRDSMEETLAALEGHLLPSGGFNYIGPETEIPCYHDLNVLWIARYLKLTGDERARSLLERTVGYYPSAYSNEARPEYYTDAWWKHYWSDGAACGPEIVAGLTGDPHNKWLADRLLERVGTGSDYKALYAGMFYRDDIEPQPLPDDYVRLDPGIGGPRGRFGNWYFAGMPGGGGRDTFVGAMVTDPAAPEPLDSALLACNVEVSLGGEGRRDQTHLYLSGPDDATDAVVAGDLAALGARYSPRKPYINSLTDREVQRTPWLATQVWLLTRHGLVGLVELEATEEQTVPYLAGEIRLGPTRRPTLDQAAGLYRCGRLSVRLIDHNFADVTLGPARPGYAQNSTPHSALRLQTAGDSHTARPGEPARYLVTAFPEGTDEPTSVRRLDVPGLFGLTCTLPEGPVAIAFNPGDTAVEARVPWPNGAAQVSVAGLDPRRTSARNGAISLGVPPQSVLVARPPE